MVVAGDDMGSSFFVSGGFCWVVVVVVGVGVMFRGRDRGIVGIGLIGGG